MTNVFDRAGDILRARGWHKGGFVERREVPIPGSSFTKFQEGGVCALGALNLAEGLDLVTGEARSSLMLTDIIMEQYPDRVHPMRHEIYHAADAPLSWLDLSVADFNDHEDTVAGDVFAMLEKASVLADELDEFQLAAA
jgi:hypothetical protein